MEEVRGFLVSAVERSKLLRFWELPSTNKMISSSQELFGTFGWCHFAKEAAFGRGKALDDGVNPASMPPSGFLHTLRRIDYLIVFYQDTFLLTCVHSEKDNRMASSVGALRRRKGSP